MTRPRRANISLETQLAAALLALRLVPFEDARAMGRTNFLSLFAYDHNVLHSQRGSDEFWNLEPMLIPAHRIKTARVDVPQAAKSKRLLEARAAGYLDPPDRPPPHRIASRGFAPGHRPLRSRNSFDRRS